MLLGLITPWTMQAQSTQGKDFWVTFMRACDNNPTALTLTISAKEATDVVIENTYTGYSDTIHVDAQGIATTNALAEANCYVGNNENDRISNHALHVHSDKEISLIAANYRDKSFDVAAILPTDALLSEYVVCTYPATDHDSNFQGTHFAVVATEDNTVIDYIPTAMTQAWRDANDPFIVSSGSKYDNAQLGDMFTTDTLMKGQVFYYWTGNIGGDASDLTGTWVKARDNKKVAVFNGDPHTNIPNSIRDRDHIYSQAMPVKYWGTQFALTSSLTTSDGASGLVERIDKVRVQALEDGTVLVVNGDTLHVFDFSVDTKHYYEFEFGTNTVASSPYPAGIRRLNTTNCFVQTSCPCGVHLYMVSNQYDYPKNNSLTGSKYCNGDPSMIWINPIEQQIEDITFGTFQTAQVKDHFLNIVTAANNNITLDGADITAEFTPMVGNANYKFVRKQITHGTHNLVGDQGFIAHVYGFGEKESYGYPAGAKTMPLEQFIIINGEKFSSDKQNTLCGKDSIHFECDLNYEIKNITWNFGDGSAEVSGDTKVDHFYPQTGVYDAFAVIERESANLCAGQTAIDTIPILVTIGKLEFKVVDTEDDICQSRTLVLKYENTGTALTSNNTTLVLNNVAQENGFTSTDLRADFANNQFVLNVPQGAEQGDKYAFTVEINTGCGDTTVVVPFSVPFDPSQLIEQRWNDVLAVRNNQTISALMGSEYQFVAYQWYKNNQEMAGETGPSLTVEGTVDVQDKYFVCMTTANGTEICTCPMSFVQKEVSEQMVFDSPITVDRINVQVGGWITINTAEAGIAYLYGVDGKLLRQYELPVGGGSIYFHEPGIHLVRVESGKQKQSFKVIAQ